MALQPLKSKLYKNIMENWQIVKKNCNLFELWHKIGNRRQSVI